MEENDKALDAGNLFRDSAIEGIRLSDEMRYYWNETARWARVISILSFFVASILGIAYVIVLSITREENPTSGGIAILIFAILIGVFYRFGKILQNFSTQFSNADRHEDQAALESSLQNLSIFYKMYGLVSITLILVAALLGLSAIYFDRLL